MSILIELHSFPCIQVFAHLANAKQLCLLADENFQKGSYRNRYHILGPNGVQRLSIPLARGKHEAQTIQDVQIVYAENWAMNHWRSIQAAYGKSPFFIHYEDEVRKLIFSKKEKLWDWNKLALDWCLEQLGLELDIIKVERSSALASEALNLWNSILPKNQYTTPTYPQVFEEKLGFASNLSILDLLFCQGPMSMDYLLKMSLKIEQKE